ncbi:1-(5-phosphoribosyl)-5-[(5-phosphoribosylamino)methylideneamino] imidazole-4-carboxamide isomerase [Bienertia sinuspersici]
MTDPFNEKVRARIFGSIGSTSSSSSGSEHDAETDVVSTSSSSCLSATPPCLSYLVQNFLESSSPASTTNDPTLARSDSDSDSDSEDYLESDPTAMVHDVVFPTVYNNADPFRKQLLCHVTKAIEIFSIFRTKSKSIFNRNLMAYLREIGYNAGICKTKWDASKNGTITAGNYEFIDVLHSKTQVRYIIDAEFCAEFEIARETENHKILRSSLPKAFVGKVDDLKKIIRLMCDEARRSMKINGLTLPPWRKNRYMQLKWLGSYRRTTNYFPTNEVPSKKASNIAVKCRSVGFNISGDKFLYPPIIN